MVSTPIPDAAHTEVALSFRDLDGFEGAGSREYTGGFMRE